MSNSKTWKKKIGERQITANVSFVSNPNGKIWWETKRTLYKQFIIPKLPLQI